MQFIGVQFCSLLPSNIIEQIDFQELSLSAPITFLDEQEINATAIRSHQVSIISAPLGNTVSWGQGTDEGPAAILAASKALEVFDDELLQETYLAGIETLPPLSLAGKSSPEACTLIEQAVEGELARGRLPVLLGGEHTVSWPAVAACQRHFPDLHVVQIDAHLDLRDTYENNRYSHACVMRRIHELGAGFTQAGIRSFSMPEWNFVMEKGLTPYTMERIRSSADWIKEACASIKGPVYITIDVDGLDPSIMPATGTPEPDGLLWRETLQFVREICSSHRIIGLDIVELAPVNGMQHAAFTAAKLLYRILGYIFRDKLVIV